MHRMDLMSLSKVRKNGIVACTLKEDDELIEVLVMHDHDDILLTTSQGMAIRFSEDDLRSIGRVAAGVRGIKLSKDDFVVGMVVVSTSAENQNDDENQDLRVTVNDTLLTGKNQSNVLKAAKKCWKR